MTVRQEPFQYRTVLVIDFGAQYAQLIARRVREANVYSEIVPHTISAAEIAARKPAGLILSGGPKSVHVVDAPSIDADVFGLGIPVLGICYGAQLIAQLLGGHVDRSGRGEYGRTAMTRRGESGLFDEGAPLAQDVWMSHFDAIVEAPEGFVVSGSTPDSPVAVLESTRRGIYGVQFHPEVVHTDLGQRLIERFLHEICELGHEWKTADIIEESVTSIRNQVGDGRAICGLSGGVRFGGGRRARA